MVASLRLAAADIEAMSQTLKIFARRTSWWLVPMVGLLNTLVLAHYTLARIKDAIDGLPMGNRRAREQRRQRRIEEEGRNMYPLW